MDGISIENGKLEEKNNNAIYSKFNLKKKVI